MRKFEFDTDENRQRVMESMAADLAEFYASGIDAFLQDYLDAVASKDHVKIMSSASRAAQMAGSMSQLFELVINPSKHGPGGKDAALIGLRTVSEVCKRRTTDWLEKNAGKFGGREAEDEPKQTGPGGGSLN